MVVYFLRFFNTVYAAATITTIIMTTTIAMTDSVDRLNPVVGVDVGCAVGSGVEVGCAVGVDVG